MKIDKKLLKRIVLTALVCAGVSFLLSFLKPSRPLLVQMESRRAAVEIRQRIEDSIGHIDESNPVYLVALSGEKECTSELEKSLTKREGFYSGYHEGAKAIRIVCSIVSGSFVFDVRLAEPEETAEILNFRVVRSVPDFTSLLPPIIAVIIAFGLREVRIALAAGIWLGALFFGGLDWTLGLWMTLRRYLLETLTDQFSFTIIVFTLSMVGMVRVAARAGGSQGIADSISKIASSARTSKIATAVLGLAIFFDDYSNTVVVGSTMRNLTDRFKVSREKLAYIVDSTTAPIAGIALISTWIGYEISLFQELSNALDLGLAGYGMFLKIVPLRFYCYFSVFFVFLTSALNRDFGPMAGAENRAATKGELTAPGSKPMLPSFVSGVEIARFVKPHWAVAAVPVAVVVFGTFAGMLLDGAAGEKASSWAGANGKLNLNYIRLCFESANGAFVLLVTSLAGTWAALIMAITKRAGVENAAVEKIPYRCPWWQLLLPLPLSLVTAAGIVAIQQGSSINGSMIFHPAYWKALFAVGRYLFILYIFITFGVGATAILAWRIFRQKTNDLRTYIPVHFVDASKAWLQGLRSLLYAVTILIMAWAIRKVCDDLGTSTFIVATMGQFAKPWMIPAMVFGIACLTSFCTGTSWGTMGILIPTLLPFTYYIGGMDILLLSMGAVLDGAIFGDHCSPVSDTTVLSSTFSSCDHMDHVKTQVPYAVFCASVALIVGYFPIAAKMPLAVVYAAGLLILAATLLALGKKLAVRKE